jgi:hypothetical protein
VSPEDDSIRIRVRRGGRDIQLRGCGDAPVALAALDAVGRRRFSGAYGVGGEGPVFRRDGGDGAALSERQAFAIVKAALVRAGFPRAGQRDLRRAFAQWLLYRGLSDHEAMLTMGIRDARTFDALLLPVRRLDAQRIVAEHREMACDDVAGV